MFDSFPIDSLFRQAIDEGVFPGAVLFVSSPDEVIFESAYGNSSVKPSRTGMTSDTIFDLASLTKPLATTVALMLLMRDGKIASHQTLAALLPLNRDRNAQPWTRLVTIRHLLSHSSGLPAYRPYFKRLRFRAPGERIRLLREWILREPLIGEPGQITCYSDLGFILLSWIIEHKTGVTLDRFVLDSIYRPLGMENSGFLPLNSFGLNKNIAATEDCLWRKKVLCGEVHDDNAYVSGGVSGHAGLFGTAQDLGIILRALLKAGLGEDSGLFSPELVNVFFSRQKRPAGTTRALGFDTPSEKGSSAGSLFSQRSVGHLGFTGVSFWMDLGKAVIIVLLTNRVHPDRNNDKIKNFRPLLHDAVMKQLG